MMFHMRWVGQFLQPRFRQWGYVQRTSTKNDESYHGCDLDDREHKLCFSVSSDTEQID